MPVRFWSYCPNSVKKKKMKSPNFDCDKCNKKLENLCAYLSISERNRYVEPYLVGNLEQALMMITIPHFLEDDNSKITYSTKGVIWGKKFLLNSNIKELRAELDNVFESIKKMHENFFDSYLPLLGKESCVKAHIELLERTLHSSVYSARRNCAGIELLTPYQQLIASIMYLQNLVKDFDNGMSEQKAYNSFVEYIGNLNKVNKGIAIFSIRKFFNLCRMIDFFTNEHLKMICYEHLDHVIDFKEE